MNNHRKSIFFSILGFYLMTTAISLCDEVNLYGYWPYLKRYNNKQMNVTYHYFDALKIDKGLKAHATSREFSILTQLHHLGVLRLHVGICDQQ